MTRMWGAIAVGAAMLAGASSPAAAKLNSCDGPIVLGTTISVTGINSSLAGRWDKLTEMFEKGELQSLIKEAAAKAKAE